MGAPNTKKNDAAKLLSDAEAKTQHVLTENVLTVHQARVELGQVLGRRPDKSTVIRWITRGCYGSRLDGVRVGRDWITSTEAISRFVVARTAGL